MNFERHLAPEIDKMKQTMAFSDLLMLRHTAMMLQPAGKREHMLAGLADAINFATSKITPFRTANEAVQSLRGYGGSLRNLDLKEPIDIPEFCSKVNMRLRNIMAEKKMLGDFEVLRREEQRKMAETKSFLGISDIKIE